MTDSTPSTLVPVSEHLRADFDSRHLRDALGTFATGVTVITTLDAEGAPVGLTISSFSPVSLNPPLVLWSLVNTAASRAAFLHNQRFTINVLAADQKALALQFASRSPDRFEGVSIESGTAGLPLLAGALAWFECKRYAEHVAGDHTIFIGEVEQVGFQGLSAAALAQQSVAEPAEAPVPLVFHRGVLHEGGLIR